METLHYLGFLVSILLIIYQKIRKYKNLPPSPPSLPIIGHLHLFKEPISQTLDNLCNKYGPILLLHLGSRPALVVSSQSAIEECLTKNDIIFANRPILPSRKNKSTYSGIEVPYGDHWRNLRRIYALQIFSPKRLQLSASIRTEEIRLMAKYLLQSSSKEAHNKVEAKSWLYTLVFNIIMRMVDGKRFFEQDEIDTAKEKRDDLIHTFTPILPTALGDYFPFLRWLTFFGAELKVRKLQRKRGDFVLAMMDEHRISDSSKHSLTDVLLKLKESEPEFYTDDVIKGIVQTMLVAGPHTTVMTMELVISWLLSHPEIFKTARDEIDKHVGQSKLIEDGDLADLRYLYAVMNETMRLDQAFRVLPPHESSKECTIGGYQIPAGTQLLVNACSVHKDPEFWEDPEKFKPERFLQSAEEREGCKFLSFGSGRRQCPAIGFAMRLMALSLGTLIQCFEWEKAEEKPLKVIFRPREDLTKILAQL